LDSDLVSGYPAAFTQIHKKRRKPTIFEMNLRNPNARQNTVKIIENTELFAIFRLHFQAEYGIIYTWI